MTKGRTIQDDAEFAFTDRITAAIARRSGSAARAVNNQAVVTFKNTGPGSSVGPMHITGTVQVDSSTLTLMATVTQSFGARRPSSKIGGISDNSEND